MLAGFQGACLLHCLPFCLRLVLLHSTGSVSAANALSGPCSVQPPLPVLDTHGGEIQSFLVACSISVAFGLSYLESLLPVNLCCSLSLFLSCVQVIDSLGPLEWVLNTPSHHRVHHGTSTSNTLAPEAGSDRSVFFAVC